MMELSGITFSIITFSIMTFSIITLSSAEQYYLNSIQNNDAH
jgi:hypothetical protein